jgi:hypothetical protein
MHKGHLKQHDHVKYRKCDVPHHLYTIVFDIRNAKPNLTSLSCATSFGSFQIAALLRRELDLEVGGSVEGWSWSWVFRFDPFPADIFFRMVMMLYCALFCMDMNSFQPVFCIIC